MDYLVRLSLAYKEYDDNDVEIGAKARSIRKHFTADEKLEALTFEQLHAKMLTSPNFVTDEEQEFAAEILELDRKHPDSRKGKIFRVNNREYPDTTRTGDFFREGFIEKDGKRRGPFKQLFFDLNYRFGGGIETYL